VLSYDAYNETIKKEAEEKGKELQSMKESQEKKAISKSLGAELEPGKQANESTKVAKMGLHLDNYWRMPERKK
jgi:hypothetical protein